MGQRHSLRASSLAFLGLLFVLIGTPCEASEVVTFSFEEEDSLMSWSESFSISSGNPEGSIAWSEQGAQTTGSLSIGRSLGSSVFRAHSPCISLRDSDEPLHVEASVRREINQGGVDCALALWLHPTQACSSDEGDVFISWMDVRTPDWSTVAYGVPIPAAARSLQVTLWADGSSPNTCHFDDVRVSGPITTSTSIPTLSARGLFGLVGSLVILSIWSLRRI